MLVLLNVMIKPLNMSKKEGTNKSNKVWSYVMLVPLNMSMKLSDVRKKKEEENHQM